MSQSLRIAIGQTVSVLNNTESNMAQVCRLSAEAAAQGAKLILLPEGCLTGNALSSPSKQATLPVDPAAFEPLRRVAMDGGITICAGFATPYEDKFNVVHAIVQPDGNVLFQRKATRASTEPTFLAPWPDATREVFEVDGVRTVMVICSEMGGKDVRAAMEAVSPELILHCSAGCVPKDQVYETDPSPEILAEIEQGMRRVADGAARKVAEERIPRIGANPIGFDGETYWPGNSFAIDATGTIRLWMKGTHVVARMAPSVEVADMQIPARVPVQA